MNTDDLVAHIAELERRLEVAEDDRAIRQLLARYGFNADTVGRGAAYVSLYTEDGAIDASNTQRWEGHAAVDGLHYQPSGAWTDGGSVYTRSGQ